LPQFFALTSRGLVDALNDELIKLGFEKTEKVPGGVFFESNWRGCYKANLCLRTSTRVVLPVLDFVAYKPEELYNNIRKHDFTKYVGPDETMAVDASVLDCAIHDQRLVAMKVKDAVVDQFRDKFGRRPDVDTGNPALRLVVRAVKNQYSVSVDTSGDPLFKRGYREQQGLAPLKEHLAASLLDIAGWDPSMPLVDPMCGSGTFLIEAALKALQIAPGTLRSHFAFQKYSNFDKDIWQEVVDEVMDHELEVTDARFYGFDIDRKALSAAQHNVVAAGVADYVTLKRSGVDMIEAPAPKGMVIVNPPYGQRLGSKAELEDVYKDLAFILKTKFKGWTAWILAGDAELTTHLKMKATRKARVFNGPIECRFLRYEIF
jgi:putative N6-adenine-specific DNA methylase